MDDLPTTQQLRELAGHCGASHRRSRCGRPGRMPSPQFRARVLARLAAASKAGRGIHWLSRDELDAVIAMIRQDGGAQTAEVRNAREVTEPLDESGALSLPKRRLHPVGKNGGAQIRENGGAKTADVLKAKEATEARPGAGHRLSRTPPPRHKDLPSLVPTPPPRKRRSASLQWPGMEVRHDR